MNIRGADGPLASLPEILDRREARAQQQMALLQQGPCVLSFCMNIPGARKAFPLAAAAARSAPYSVTAMTSGESMAL